MEWITAIKSAVKYMENSLLSVKGPDEVAENVHISAMYLQNGFRILTGYTLGEYIRNRRLYLAALDITGTDMKIIDIAYKYCYDTPESFTKAFTRFHGASPSDVRRGRGSIRTFLPISIDIHIHGGNSMEMKIMKMSGFRVIGFQKEFAYESAYAEIPKFWSEIAEKYFSRLSSGTAAQDDCLRAIADNCIGEYGVCIDDIGADKFRYLIAGKFTGGEVPAGMEVYEFRQGEWAVFDCTGPLPDALQSVNTKIFREWLPGNPEYELCGNANIEWYDSGDMKDPGYRSAIWVPVKRK